MGTDNYILIIGSILVGLILFFAAQVYLIGSVDETEGYITKGTAERIVSVLEKLTGEPSYASYCFNISLSDLKVENGYLTFRQSGKEFVYPVPKEINNVDLKEIASVCFVHLANGEIIISEELPNCDMNTLCTADECFENCPDCYGPDSLCIGDGFCNPDIGENCLNSPDCICNITGSNPVCCPEDHYSDEFGCVDKTRLNRSKGEECFCDNECNINFSCNPVSPIYGPGKACCDPGKSWNGTNCIWGGDVLIVALKSNMQTVYSPAQITQLENKIKAYQSALGSDGLGSIFLYLDEDETSDIIGSKVTNPGNWNNIDSILDQLILKLNSSYLVIIGGYDRFVQINLGVGPHSYPIHSDDRYGDIDNDGKLDIPVGRFPDPNNGDLSVILNALDTSINLHNSGGLDLSDYTSSVMDGWDDGKRFHKTVFSKVCSADSRCIIYPNCKLSESSGKSFFTVLLHGSHGTPQKFSCNKGWECGCAGWGSNSFSPSKFSSLDVKDSLWFTMTCSGSVIYNKPTTSSSIPMTFLKKGGSNYFGNACITPGGVGCICELYIEIAKRFTVGDRIGDDFLKGKNYYLNHYNCWAGTAYQYNINCLYGDPTLKIKKIW